MADAIPVGSEAPKRHPGTVQLLGWFEYEHLPTDLGVVSMQFHHLAHELADRLPDSAELSVALRKLLEGKDAAVRAALELRRSQEGTQQAAVERDVAPADRSEAEQSAPPPGPEYVVRYGESTADGGDRYP